MGPLRVGNTTEHPVAPTGIEDSGREAEQDFSVMKNPAPKTVSKAPTWGDIVLEVVREKMTARAFPTRFSSRRRPSQA
jgi:hypothetical protein